MENTLIVLLKKWWKTHTSRRTSPPQQKQYSQQCRKLCLEPLENRELLSVATMGVCSKDSQITESEIRSTFHIDCSEVTPIPLNVPFQATGSTIPGLDYSLYTSTGDCIDLTSHRDSASGLYVYRGSVNIPAGSSSVTVELRPIDDAFYENDESITLTLLPSNLYTVDPTKCEATVTIQETTTVTLTTIDPIALEPCPWISGNDRKGTFRLNVETTETGWDSLTVILNVSGAAEAGSNGTSGDYHLTTNPNGGSPSDIIPVSNGQAVVTIPPGQKQLDIYAIPNGDKIFEEDEELDLTIEKLVSEQPMDPSISIKNNADSVWIFQSPEFKSDNDLNFTNKVNSDHYEYYMNPNEKKGLFREGVSIKAVIPKDRTCLYAFYDPVNGNSLDSPGTNPLLTINEETGKITVQRKLTEEEIKSPPSFTVKAYDSVYNELYDLATLTIVPTIVDIDIDSDNTYQGTVGQPDRSSEEEFFENYKYAPGKIMKPNWGDTDHDGLIDCWDGYSNGGANHNTNGSSSRFYPIALQIPDDISLSEMKIRLNYRMASLTVSSSIINERPEGEGTIRIWKKDGGMARNGLSATVGGDLILSSEEYTPKQLGFTTTKRTIFLYVEAVTENEQVAEKLRKNLLDKKFSPEDLPKTTIQFSVTIENLGTIEDEVKYVVSNVGSFYYELMTHPELMATYASEAIYEYDDKAGCGLKFLGVSELQNLGFSNSIVNLLTFGDPSNGFKAGIYQEYITGKYILAFAGTEPTDWNDWETDFTQTFGKSSDQYNYAICLGRIILNNPVFTISNTYITGHSLGGGLASAASISSGFHAYTFNAAGLHPDTVHNDANLAMANQLIDAYYVEKEILHLVQQLPDECLNKLAEIKQLIHTYVDLVQQLPDECLNELAKIKQLIHTYVDWDVLNGVQQLSDECLNELAEIKQLIHTYVDWDVLYGLWDNRWVNHVLESSIPAAIGKQIKLECDISQFAQTAQFDLSSLTSYPHKPFIYIYLDVYVHVHCIMVYDGRIIACSLPNPIKFEFDRHSISQVILCMEQRILD